MDSVAESLTGFSETSKNISTSRGVFPAQEKIAIGSPSIYRAGDPRFSWACGPPKVMKKTSVRQPLSIEPVRFPLSSRAQPRDLRFYGPSLEMFFPKTLRAQLRSMPFATEPSSPHFSPVELRDGLTGG